MWGIHTDALKTVPTSVSGPSTGSYGANANMLNAIPTLVVLEILLVVERYWAASFTKINHQDVIRLKIHSTSSHHRFLHFTTLKMGNYTHDLTQLPGYA
jgi:hypothetical protein